MMSSMFSPGGGGGGRSRLVPTQLSAATSDECTSAPATCSSSGRAHCLSTVRPSGMTRSQEYRKVAKPMMEKRRREKINKLLYQLKGLILEAMKRDTSQGSKLEKADILELTVKYLQNLQRHQLATALALDPTVLTKYSAGFSECLHEVSRYLGTVSGVETGLKLRLLAHLHNSLQTFPLHLTSPSRPSHVTSPRLYGATPTGLYPYPGPLQQFTSNKARRVLDQDSGADASDRETYSYEHEEAASCDGKSMLSAESEVAQSDQVSSTSSLTSRTRCAADATWFDDETEVVDVETDDLPVADHLQFVDVNDEDDDDEEDEEDEDEVWRPW